MTLHWTAPQGEGLRINYPQFLQSIILKGREKSDALLCAFQFLLSKNKTGSLVLRKTQRQPAPKGWMVFGSLGRNLSFCDGKFERVVSLTAQARKGLGVCLGAILAPREPETTRVLYSEIKKTCLLQHQVPSNFLLKIISQEMQRGFLWREAVSFVLIAHGENWSILLLASLCNIIRKFL